MVCLINGSTVVRSRESEGTTILECGCAFTDSPYQWTQMCRPHCVETAELHERARVQHDTDAAIKELTT